MAAGLKRTLCFLALACAIAPHPSGVVAEVLVDPTRPPVGMGVSGQNVEPPRRPVLQSIIITRESRAAIIDDERVVLHGKFRDAVVAQITETEVVLRSPAGIETLKMYPDVAKTPVRREPSRIIIKPSRPAGDKP